VIRILSEFKKRVEPQRAQRETNTNDPGGVAAISRWLSAAIPPVAMTVTIT
jgi:hypothetical protein